MAEESDSPVIDLFNMFSFVVHDEDDSQKIHGHEHHDDVSFVVDFAEKTCQKLSQNVTCRYDHLEGSVESSSFHIRHIGLRGGDSDVERGDAHDADDEEAQHHQWYREVEIEGFQERDGGIDGDGDEKLLVYRVLILVMDESSGESSQYTETADDGIEGHHVDGDVREELRIVLEEGQMENVDAAACEHGDEEVGGNHLEALLLFHVLESFLEIRFIGNHGETLVLTLVLLHMHFCISDSGLKECRYEKSHRIEGEKWCSGASSCIDDGGHRHHEGSQGIDHAGDGVRLGKVSFGDQIRVEAFIGYTVYTIDGSDEEHDSEENRIIEPVRSEKQKHQKEDRRGEKIQGVDDFLSGEPVQIGTCKKGCHDLGQIVDHHEQGKKQCRLGIIQHQQSDGKSGYGISEHGDDGAYGDDLKIFCP